MTNKQTNINKKLKLHYFLLIAAVVVGTFISGPKISSMATGQWIISGAIISFISIFPLLFFIPTVLKPTVRGISWFGFFILAYMVWGVLKIFSPNGLIAGVLISTFIMTSFLYTVIWLRPFKKEFKKQKKEQEDEF